MAELIFEPFAARLHWRSPAAPPDWTAVLSAFLEGLATSCLAAGTCVIGHIKALALFPAGDFLRLSITRPHQVADVDGRVPPETTELTLSLNVLVYGIPGAVLRELTRDSAERLALLFPETAHFDLETPAGPEAGHAHDHDER